MSMKRQERRVVREYSRLADEYDERWASYIETTTARTLAHLQLVGDERLLDVGCGTGALLRAVAAEYPAARLSGIDLSLPMLAASSVQSLTAATASALPILSASVDVVV